MAVVPSGSLFNNWLSILIFFPIGFLIFLVKIKQGDNSIFTINHS